MADDAQQLKTIADDLETARQNLRQSASNIAALLQVGRGTCDQARAHNVWSLAVFNSQQALLDALKDAGAPTAQAPVEPTLFRWKGPDTQAQGCATPAEDLRGLMDAALRAPSPVQPFVSTNEVEVVTRDKFAMTPGASPDVQMLVELQAQRAIESQQITGLGSPVGIVLLIGGLVVTTALVATGAIMQHLAAQGIDASSAAQAKEQTAALATYTQAQVACITQCHAQGKTDEQCTAECAAIKAPTTSKELPLWAWIGIALGAGVLAVVAWRVWRYYREGGPVFELPESTAEAISTATSAVS